jgi:hypothetical protein
MSLLLVLDLVGTFVFAISGATAGVIRTGTRARSHDAPAPRGLFCSERRADPQDGPAQEGQKSRPNMVSSTPRTSTGWTQ